MKKIDREKQILKFIEQYHAEHHWAPSVREIREAIGLKSTSQVHEILVGTVEFKQKSIEAIDVILSELEGVKNK